MSKFKVGDEVRRIVRDQSFGEPAMRIGDIGNVTGFNGEEGVYVKGYQIANLRELLELVNSPKEEKQKLIENTKMDADNIKGVDVKILKLAKEEVEKERADAQQKEAEEYYRNLMNQKDEAEKVVKEAGIDKKEIDKQLKVFDSKK